MRQTLTALLLLMLGTGIVASQGNSTEGTPKHEPISGKQLYASYCAVCHGVDARGGGPFSPQLKVWPSDLTVLARKNNAVFPAMHVREAIDGEYGTPAHGPREMPVWGPVFRSMAHGHGDNAQLRINNVAEYLQSLQQK
jgi:mono/diheme cytochrome c family protein